MTARYILKDNEIPVAEPDFVEWAVWYKTANRSVAKFHIGEVEVSTVFLSIDHNFGGGGPILWETMVFGGPLDQQQVRCGGTREQAEAMHAEMVERVKCSFKPQRR